MLVTIRDAKTNLSKLIEAAFAGEEVIIVKGKKPVAKLVALRKTRFKIGLLKGRVAGFGPDFFEPMAEEDLELWESGK